VTQDGRGIHGDSDGDEHDDIRAEGQELPDVSHPLQRIRVQLQPGTPPQVEADDQSRDHAAHAEVAVGDDEAQIGRDHGHAELGGRGARGELEE